MKKAIRLKTNRLEGFFIVSVIVVLSAAVLGGSRFVEERVLHFALMVVMSMAGIFHLSFLLRTRNWVYAASALFYGLGALTFAGLFSGLPKPLILGMAVSSFMFFCVFMYLLATRRMKWRYHEILELAARPVEEFSDGFADRPYPAGKVAYTREEIGGFAVFALKYAIACPYFESDRIVLTVPRNMALHFLFIKRNYEDETYIAFSNDGNVSVKISNRDYEKYRDELTFNLLCRSFRRLFEEFLELYIRGESEKIIRRLNSVGFIL